MASRPNRSYDYETIDFIHYLKVIKKHMPGIGGIIIAMILVAVTFNLLQTNTIKYQSEAILIIGSFQNQPIEAPEQVISLAGSSYPDIAISAGKTPSEIIIRSKGESPEMAERMIQNTIDGLREHHRLLYEAKLKKRTDEIEVLKTRLKQYEDTLAQYEQKINDLSPQAQAIALQTYVVSYSTMLERINGLQTKINDLESQSPDYSETRIKDQISLGTESTYDIIKKSLVAGILGAILGLVIALFWAFSREWWEKNRALLK